MSLFEEDRNKVPKSPVYQYSITRGETGQGDQPNALATDAVQFAHSLELLRNTSLHLSLFKIILSDLKPEVATAVMRHAFGNRGMISTLSSGGFALLMIGTEIEEPITNAQTVQTLYASLAELGLRAHLEIAVIHRPAPEIGDPEDILVHLSGMPTETHLFGRAA
jgi:hypothetical protein